MTNDFQIPALTDLQAAIFAAWPMAYDTAEATASDLGSTWTDVEDIAKATGLPVKSVRGALGRMTKAGWVQSDENPEGEAIQCLTEEGAKIAHALRDQAKAGEAPEPAPEPSPEPQPTPEPAPEPEAEEAQPDWPAEFKRMMTEAGYAQPRNLCRALRLVARHWLGRRKDFLAGAEALGLNTANAAAEWQAGRNGKE